MYRHYKGGIYKKVGRAKGVKESEIQNKWLVSEVRYHEGTHNVKLYTDSGTGNMYVVSDIEYVVYKSQDGEFEGTVWVREKDDFEAWIVYDGMEQRRFRKM